MEFSVAMCVYGGDNARDFVGAVRSIYTEQTVRPAEVIVVVDGPVSAEHDGCLALLETEIPVLRVVRLEQNVGHAGARQRGLDEARFDWVAVMDADDIAVPERFEKQLSFISDNPDVAVVGGQITEFVGSPENVVGERVVPQSDCDIKRYLKARCPMNLVTVMYRKSSVASVGGFIDWYCEEDYYLWVRMALAGCRMANLGDVLVNVRVGADMYRRRGGWRYFRSEARLQGFMLRHRVIGMPRYLFNVAARFAVQVAMPNRLRGFVFQKLFRK